MGRWQTRFQNREFLPDALCIRRNRRPHVDMRIEVRQALWVALADAGKQLAYSNERKVLRQAEDYVEKQGLSA